MNNIRIATKEDSIAIAQVLGELITAHNEDIAIKRAIIKELEQDTLTSESVLYYGYCHVYEVNNEVVGVISSYPGELDHQLMAHLMAHLATLTSQFAEPHSDLAPEQIQQDASKEIIPQGYYLSMVSVLPQYQGQKIGQKLIDYIEKFAKENGYPCVSLKVEKSNSRAEALYKRLNYQYVDEYQTEGVVLKYFEKFL